MSALPTSLLFNPLPVVPLLGSKSFQYILVFGVQIVPLAVAALYPPISVPLRQLSEIFLHPSSICCSFNQRPSSIHSSSNRSPPSLTRLFILNDKSPKCSAILLLNSHNCTFLVNISQVFVESLCYWTA